MAEGQTCSHCNHPCHCDENNKPRNECTEEGCNCKLCDCHDIE